MATKLAFDVDFLDLVEGVIIALLSFTPFDAYQFKAVSSFTEPNTNYRRIAEYGLPYSRNF